MIFSIVVCFAACAGLIVSVLLKPSVRIKRTQFQHLLASRVCGGFFCVLCGVLPAKEAWAGLTASGEMNPLKILALFVSLTFLSVYLDELGFFHRLACVLLRRAKGSQKKLFFLSLCARVRSHRIHLQRHRRAHVHALHLLFLQGGTHQPRALPRGGNSSRQIRGA